MLLIQQQLPILHTFLMMIKRTCSGGKGTPHESHIKITKSVVSNRKTILGGQLLVNRLKKSLDTNIRSNYDQLNHIYGKD